MNKILKSILIATASVGAVAGSVASVVSCGEEKGAVQKDYDSLIEKIVNYFGNASNSIKMKHNGVEVASTKTPADYIQDEINYFIQKDASVTADERLTVGTVTVSTTDATFDSLRDEPKVGHASITITATNDLKAADLTNFTFNYVVGPNATESALIKQNYTGAINAIKAAVDTATSLFLINHDTVVNSSNFASTDISNYVKHRINDVVKTLPLAQQDVLMIGNNSTGISVNYVGTALNTTTTDPIAGTGTLNSNSKITVSILGVNGSGAETQGTSFDITHATYGIWGAAIFESEAGRKTFVDQNFDVYKEFCGIGAETMNQQFPMQFDISSNADKTVADDNIKNSVASSVKAYVVANKYNPDINKNSSWLNDNITASNFSWWEYLKLSATPGKHQASTFTYDLSPVLNKPSWHTGNVFQTWYWINSPDETNVANYINSKWTSSNPMIISKNNINQGNIIKARLQAEINSVLTQTGTPNYHGMNNVFVGTPPAAPTIDQISLTGYVNDYTVGVKNVQLWVRFDPATIKSGMKSFYTFNISIKVE